MPAPYVSGKYIKTGFNKIKHRLTLGRPEYFCSVLSRNKNDFPTDGRGM